jgi:hypothetical protein
LAGRKPDGAAEEATQHVSDRGVLEAHFQADDEPAEDDAERDVRRGAGPRDGLQLVRRDADRRHEKTARENVPGHHVTPGENDYECATLEPPAQKIK